MGELGSKALPYLIGLDAAAQFLVLFGLFGLNRFCDPARWFGPGDEVWDDGRVEAKPK